MNKTFKSLSKIFIAYLLVISFFSCNKFDETAIGNDVIPTVDNIKTFADTLTVTTNCGVWPNSENHVLNNFSLAQLGQSGTLAVVGKIENSAGSYFGSTDAEISILPKPNFFPFTLGKQANDTVVYPGDPNLKMDSVVLCLDYQGAFGDTSTPIHFQVLQNDKDNNPGFYDSTENSYYRFSYNYKPITSTLLGEANILTGKLNKFVYLKRGAFKDSVNNQIRIKFNLNHPACLAFIDSLYKSDTTLTSTLNPQPNKRFSSNENFTNFFRGFTIRATSGKALLFTKINSNKTRLELHYRKRNNGSLDTTYSTLNIVTATIAADGTQYGKISAYSNFIKRDSIGSNFLATGRGADSVVFIQTAPGTFANIILPSLTNYGNKLIHRAELICKQIPNTPHDKIFAPPSLMYLDARFAPGVDSFRNIPSVLQPPFNNIGALPITSDYQINGTNFGFFGGFVKGVGNPIRNEYNFNLTRYIQGIITQQKPQYNLRLFAPAYYNYKAELTQRPFLFNPTAEGEVKLGGGNHPTQKMILRIVYSKV